MTKNEFKQRMQQLKTYREQNPGKGYWDWKIEQFQNRGEEDNRTDHPIYRPIIPQRIERTINGVKWSDLPVVDRLRNSRGRIDGRPTEQGLIEVYPEFDLLLGIKGIINMYRNSPKIIGELSRTKVNGENTVQLNGKPFGEYIGEGSEQFVVQSSDDASRVMKVYADIEHKTRGEAKKAAKEYLKRNKIPYSEKVFHEGYVKDTEGKLYNVFSQRKLQTINADSKNLEDLERKVLTPVMDNMMYKKGYSGTFTKGYNKGSKYIGDISPYNVGFTSKGELRFIDAYPEGFENGGEIPPELYERSDYELGYNPVYVNPITGKPLATGIARPLFDISDAASVTPVVGDIMTMADMYEAAHNRDYIGLGLASLGLIPFVPSLANKAARIQRRTPTVQTKQQMQDLIDRQMEINDRMSRIKANANNQTYSILERLTWDPSYIDRANDVRIKYGDDYTQIYADLINAYNTNPSILPKAKVERLSNPEARAEMRTTVESTRRHMQGGKFPELGEYTYSISPQLEDVTTDITVHELNHLADFLRNQSGNAVGESNIFRYMQDDINKANVKIDANDNYFKSPTEQKAYMNQLREYMYNTGKIINRNQPVNPKVVTQTLKEIKDKPQYQSIIQASKYFGDVKKYTKWMNTIPLLGIGLPLVMNNNQEE